MLIGTGLDSDSRWSFAARCDGRDAVTYYYALAGLWEGISPYDRAAIFARFGEYTHFVYPIFAAPLLLPLIVFDLDAAVVLFGLLHVVGFAALVRQWRRLLPVEGWLLALLLPVGFGATAVHDLCSSNVVTFEALALWSGVLLLWRRRMIGFVAWIAVAALPKLLWLAMLPLGLRSTRAAWPWLVAVGGAIALTFALWFFAWPQGLFNWLGNLRVTTHIRYNVFTGLRALDRLFGGEAGEALWQRWEVWGYAFWLVFVAAASLAVLKRGAGLRGLTVLAPLTLLVVWPGNLSYSWLIALPCAAAAIFFLLQRGWTVWALLLSLFLLVPQPVLDWIGLAGRSSHGTFLTVVALWLALGCIVLAWPQAFERWLERADAE